MFSTNTQSRLASVVVDGVLGPPRLGRHTWRGPCMSVVSEATHEVSRGPEKGAVSSQKALRGSKTETRELLEGTEENCGHWFALQENQWFFTLPASLYSIACNLPLCATTTFTRYLPYCTYFLPSHFTAYLFIVTRRCHSHFFQHQIPLKNAQT